jgi:hypothetical protein
MAAEIHLSDQVKVFLSNKGWFEGKVVKIDPYSGHRSFYWVELDAGAQKVLGMRMISVFNPKNIQKL